MATSCEYVKADDLGFVKDAEVCLLSMRLEDVQAVTKTRLTVEQFRQVVDVLQEELNEGFLGRVKDAVDQVMADHPDNFEDSE